MPAFSDLISGSIFRYLPSGFSYPESAIPESSLRKVKEISDEVQFKPLRSHFEIINYMLINQFTFSTIKGRTTISRI
jgi:hypothetical protein